MSQVEASLHAMLNLKQEHILIHIRRASDLIIILILWREKGTKTLYQGNPYQRTTWKAIFAMYKVDRSSMVTFFLTSPTSPRI